VATDRTRVSVYTPHKAGFHGRVARTTQLLKGKNENPHICGRKYSGDVKVKLNFVEFKDNASCGASQTPLITQRTPPPQ